MKNFPKIHGRSAYMSGDGYYRYVLSRHWREKSGSALFVCLNPSTADEKKDDPTLRRCMRFAEGWGFGEMTLVNLFALRSRNPMLLRIAPDPVGPDNDFWIKSELDKGHSSVVVAWGSNGRINGRDIEVYNLIRDAGQKPMCLGLTLRDEPRHPLYLAKESPRREFQMLGGRS